jgi:hypothetical protein
MIDQLTSMGWGIVLLAIVIVVGVTILAKFGKVATAQYCGADTGGAKYVATSTCLCSNVSNGGTECLNPADPYGANASAGYLTTQLGSSGLAGYVPLIIIAAIGLGILGWFMAGRGRKV